MPINMFYGNGNTFKPKTYLKSAAMLFIKETVSGAFKKCFNASLQLEGLKNCRRSKLGKKNAHRALHVARCKVDT